VDRPWGAGTIRGLGSALLIPIVVWTITRVLERYLLGFPVRPA
jgi:hypothetical protein